MPQPWLFDQGLEREQNPVVSVLLSNHIVFVEIQLPASTQELIAGILYLTLVFNKEDRDSSTSAPASPAFLKHESLLRLGISLTFYFPS